MKKLLVFIVFTVFIISGCGKSENKITEQKSEQKQESKNETSAGQTENNISGEITEIKLPTIQCGTCKKNITKALKSMDGMNEVDVNVKDKIVKVNFDKSKTNLEKIEGTIVMAGYQANDKPANKESYDKLESCCKIGGH